MLLARSTAWRLQCRASTEAKLCSRLLPHGLNQCQPRASLYKDARQEPSSATPDFAFAFDIDGVLLRGTKALPHAAKVLDYLQQAGIPHILLTNGGGYHEDVRAQRLTQELEVTIDPSIIVQSHTPFAMLDHLKNKTVMVVGGEFDRCKTVAERYGFQSVVTSSEILTAYPAICPFSCVFMDYHKEQCRSQPLPRPIDPSDPTKSLKVDAIFVYNDPRDWQLDATIILDCLLSKDGVIGTRSEKNGNPGLKNRGYQQDGQPPLYFSNPDLWFAAEFNLPRLGQGGFHAALEGLWAAATDGALLNKTIIGKPHHLTYEFAEKRLNDLRTRAASGAIQTPLKNVYMIGDNPESDIRGATSYQSSMGSKWQAALVRTGVYPGGQPSVQPDTTVDNVLDAVNWGLECSGHKGRV